jgi:hypothetical protein
MSDEILSRTGQRRAVLFSPAIHVSYSKQLRFGAANPEKLSKGFSFAYMHPVKNHLNVILELCTPIGTF